MTQTSQTEKMFFEPDPNEPAPVQFRKISECAFTAMRKHQEDISKLYVKVGKRALNNIEITNPFELNIEIDDFRNILDKIEGHMADILAIRIMYTEKVEQYRYQVSIEDMKEVTKIFHS